MKSEEDLKAKLPIKTKENNLVRVRALGQKLRAVQRSSFRKKYGYLLGLLNIQVQTSLITTFAQYYDPLVRAFTFQDFQLVPTIEEFEQILDLPLEGKSPYKYVDHHTSNSIWDNEDLPKRSRKCSSSQERRTRVYLKVFGMLFASIS